MALLCLLFSAVSAAAPPRPAETGGLGEGRPGPVRLASGPSGGMYRSLAEQMRRDGEKIEIVGSQGSVENLDLLIRGQADLAFAQQDVVSEYFRTKPETGLRVAGRLFFDYLHIFLRNSIGIQTTDDLARLRIFAGPEGSGTFLTATHFLDNLGISSLGPNVVTTCGGTEVKLDSAEKKCVSTAMPRAGGALAQWFAENRLDGAMLVTTPGAPVPCNWMGSARLRLLSLDPKTLRLLTLEETTDFHRQTAIGTIPAGTYRNQDRPVATIAVPVLLVARRGTDPELARRLLRGARAAWEHRIAGSATSESRAVCRIPDGSPDGPPLIESGLRILEGLEDEEPAWPPAFHMNGLLMAAILLAALLLAGRRFGWHVHLRRHWREDRLPFVLVVLLSTSILLVTLVTYLAERGRNENFSTLTESFWSITVYLFSGLEDRTPYTTLGRVVATLGLLLGPALFAVTSGWLAQFFIKRERRMPQNLRDHYLLLNWNERAAAVVRELHHPLLRERQGVSVVVVLTDDDTLNVQQIRQAGSGWDPAFEDFYLSIGDPTDERALLNANAQDARTILILGDDKQGDERTLRSLVLLRKIARERGLTGMHAVAELTSQANILVINELAKDFPGLLEHVSALHMRTCLLAQAALTQGVVGFYTDLLRVSDDTNEVYTHPLPESAAGLSFREYASLVLSTPSEEPLIPVGLQRAVDGRIRIYTNPLPGQPGWILERGDHLVLIAYQPPTAGALPIPAGREAQTASSPSPLPAVPS